MIDDDDDDNLRVIIYALLIGALIGSVLTIGIPWWWELVRPFIHEVTR